MEFGTTQGFTLPSRFRGDVRHRCRGPRGGRRNGYSATSVTSRTRLDGRRQRRLQSSSRRRRRTANVERSLRRWRASSGTRRLRIGWTPGASSHRVRVSRHSEHRRRRTRVTVRPTAGSQSNRRFRLAQRTRRRASVHANAVLALPRVKGESLSLRALSEFVSRFLRLWRCSPTQE